MPFPKRKTIFFQTQRGRRPAQPFDRAGIADQDDILPLKAVDPDLGLGNDSVAFESERLGQNGAPSAPLRPAVPHTTSRTEAELLRVLTPPAPRLG